jgi:mono/diheme cytochrome c family protein
VAKRKPTSGPRAPQAPRPPEPPPRPGPLARLRATVRRFGFAIVLVVAIAGGVAIGLRQNRDQASEGFGDESPTTATTAPPFRSEQESAAGQPVKEVFGHTCGTCHTLRRAGVRGGIGPDLDRVVLTTRQVREMIRTGSLDTIMPRNLLVGADADRVARYVARESLASRRARRG